MVAVFCRMYSQAATNRGRILRGKVLTEDERPSLLVALSRDVAFFEFGIKLPELVLKLGVCRGHGSAHSFCSNVGTLRHLAGAMGAVGKEFGTWGVAHRGRSEASE